MSLEIEGKVIKILPEQTGQSQRGKWIKQEFVIETEDKFPKKMCFTAWGDKTDAIKKMSEGQKVKVSFNAESREYNERWYTELKAWKIDFTSGGSSKPEFNAPPPFSEDDIPPPDEEEIPF